MDGVAILGAGLYPKIGTPSPLFPRDNPAILTPEQHISSPCTPSEQNSWQFTLVLPRRLTHWLKKPRSFLGFVLPISQRTMKATMPALDLMALLARPDVHAVVISLPTLVQPSIALQCLAAGKHVLMEKPITKDVATGIDLIKEYETTYQPKGLILACGEQFRFDPGHLTARDIVASGKIGKLEAVHLRKWECARQGNPWFETPWRKHPEYQGGFLLDGGVHFVSLVRFVAGEIEETAAFAKQTMEYLPPVDTVHAALKFANGAMGTLSMSWGSARDEYSYVFVGREGSMTVGRGDGGTKIVVSDSSGKVISDKVVSGAETYKNMFGVLFDAIKEGKGQLDPRANARQGVADVAVVESVIHGGGKVKVIAY